MDVSNTNGEGEGLDKTLHNNMPQAWGNSAWIIIHIPMFASHDPDDFWTFTAGPKEKSIIVFFHPYIRYLSWGKIMKPFYNLLAAPSLQMEPEKIWQINSYLRMQPCFGQINWWQLDTVFPQSLRKCPDVINVFAQCKVAYKNHYSFARSCRVSFEVLGTVKGRPKDES